MQYVGLDKQIRRNNFNSTLLLIAFPALLLGMLYAILFFTTNEHGEDPDELFLQSMPVVLAATGIWFLIAWSGHAAFIRMATGSKPLERMENKRVYNLVENLCISQGMQTPKIYLIEDDSLNAFASGIDKKSYAISLSRGIINKLDDEELELSLIHISEPTRPY